MNDQNRWEYEVQRHQEREEIKRKLFAFSIWGFLWTAFFALMYAALAA